MDTAFSFGKISESVKKQKRANMQFIYLIILGVLAGIVAAVASMASLVSYPGLLLFGLSPVSANMTNTAALVTTGFGSLSSYLKEMRGNWGELWRYAFFQLTGALIGGWLLVKFPGKIFQKLVPFFVLFQLACSFTAAGKSSQSRRPSWEESGLILACSWPGSMPATLGRRRAF